MTRTELPAFKGKPFIEIPQDVPRIGFLKGDFGKAFLEEYAGRARTDYKNASALNVLKYSDADNIIKGSNPFAVVLANQILKQEGLRTATQADLEKAMRFGVLYLGRTSEDTGLVLKSEDDLDLPANIPLAKNLGNQLQLRGIEFSPDYPVMIPLIGLELENAENPYGLLFKLREDAEVYEAPILKANGKFTSEDIDEKTGLPGRLGEGDRPFHTRHSGLSRLDLSNLGLHCDYRFLNYSLDSYRIVVVKTGETK